MAGSASRSRSGTGPPAWTQGGSMMSRRVLAHSYGIGVPGHVLTVGPGSSTRSIICSAGPGAVARR